MLAEVVTDKVPGRKGLEQALHAAKQCLDASTFTPVSLSLPKWSRVCGVELRNEEPLEMQVLPPARVDLVGSFLLGTSARPNVNVVSPAPEPTLPIHAVPHPHRRTPCNECTCADDYNSISDLHIDPLGAGDQYNL